MSAQEQLAASDEATGPSRSTTTDHSDADSVNHLQIDVVPSGKRKSHEIWYRDKYRLIYNAAIEQRNYYLKEDLDVEPSQIALTHWTSAEKDHLLDAIARYGYINLQRVVQAVPSKSEAQIVEYLDLLQKGSIEVETDKPVHWSVDLEDIPSAFEIGNAYVNLEEHVASALAARQYDHELELERQLYGNFALIDYNLASTLRARSHEVQHSSDEDDDQDNETSSRSSSLPQDIPEPLANTADFFNVPKLIELSTRIYMAPLINDDTDDPLIIDQNPAILASALQDLHYLIVQTTRRLLSAVLFHTASRLRATDHRGARSRSEKVTTQDVLATLDVLKWPQSWFEYWVTAARRNHLQVYEHTRHLPRKTERRGRPHNVTPLSYEDVEDRLRNLSRSPSPSSRSPSRSRSLSRASSQPRSQSRSRSRGKSTMPPVKSRRDSEDPKSATHDTIDNPAKLDTPPSSPESDLSSLLSSPAPQPAQHATYSDQEDAYVDALDLKASREEEKKLLQIFQRKRQRSASPDLSSNMPMKPNKRARRRRTPAEMLGWRYETEMPRADWEDLGYELTDDEMAGTLAERRIKMRDRWSQYDDPEEIIVGKTPRVLARPRRLSTSGSESDGDRIMGESGTDMRNDMDTVIDEEMMSENDQPEEQEEDNSVRSSMEVEDDTAEDNEVEQADDTTRSPRGSTSRTTLFKIQEESGHVSPSSSSSRRQRRSNHPPSQNQPIYAFAPVEGLARAEDLQSSDDDDGEWRQEGDSRGRVGRQARRSKGRR